MCRLFKSFLINRNACAPKAMQAMQVALGYLKNDLKTSDDKFFDVIYVSPSIMKLDEIAFLELEKVEILQL